MERRDLLKAGAVLSLGGSGCATLVSHPGAAQGSALGGFLAALDGAREAIARTPLFESFRDPSRPGLDSLVDSRAELTRKVFRSLTLAGSLADLPHEQRTHPEVLRRLQDSMGEMDDAMFGMTGLLEDLTPAERAQVGKALRDDPNLGMRVMGEVDREAAALGLSSSLRLRMRTASTQVAARLRLSPELAISDCTSKFRKLEARHGARAEAERQLAASFAQSMLWAGEEAGTSGAIGGGTGEPLATPSRPPPLAAGAGASRPGQRQCVDNNDCEKDEVCGGYQEVRPEEWSLGVCQPGKRPMKRSPVLLTVGALSLGVGAALALPAVGSGLGGAIFITLGAIIAASGLIVLLIGLGFLAGGR